MRPGMLFMIVFLARLSFGQEDTLSLFLKDMPHELSENVYTIPITKKTRQKYPQVELICTQDTNHIRRYVFKRNREDVGGQLIIGEGDTLFWFLPHCNDTFQLNAKKLIVFNNPLPKLFLGAEFTIMCTTGNRTDGPVMSAATFQVYDGGYFFHLSDGTLRKCIKVDDSCYLCLEIFSSSDGCYLQTSYTLDFTSRVVTYQQLYWEGKVLHAAKYKFSGELIEEMK